MKLLHICEVCSKTEILTPEEAYDLGWDYPPIMGSFGVVSARTCPNCPINKTIWWKIVINNSDLNNLSEKDKETLNRIINEPKSILIED